MRTVERSRRPSLPAALPPAALPAGLPVGHAPPAVGPWVGAVLAAALLTAAGCTAPVLTVRHAAPAALPLPRGVTGLRAAALRVEPAGKAACGATAADLLGERLAAMGLAAPADAGPGAAAVLHVGGTMRVETSDRSGVRSLRQWDAATRRWTTVEAPSLVRTAAVHVTFTLTAPGAARPMISFDARQAYDSTADPRVRGDLGLERPDDPARVPADDQVLRELLAACVERFCEAIRPVEVTAQVALRPTLQGDGAAGLRAAQEGRTAEAVEHFQAAVAAKPDDAGLRFNLAAACEAAGRIEDALAQYLAVLDRTGGADRPAGEAAARLRGVLRLRGRPGP